MFESPGRALGLWLCLFGLGSCKSGGSSESAPSTAPEPRLVFSDSFERTEFGDDWATASSAWTLVDGEIAVAGARNEGLWLQVELPDHVRIEFEARALAPEGDLKFEVFTDGRTHQSGYVGIFGGWNNQLNVMARLDEHGDDRLVGAEGQHVEPGRTYEFTIERSDGRVRWSIDGIPFMTYDDAEPLVGDGHRYFGFNDWEAPVRFDNVRVWDLAAAGE